MKAFFLLRGAPASGKTTWCEENLLTDYAVRSDAWKIKVSGYKKDENGRDIVSHDNLDYVWFLIHEDLRTRMKRNDAIVIMDSNNRRNQEVEQYVSWFDEFGYKGYLVDFYSDTTLEECLQRNLSRDPKRFCPEWAIERFFNEIEQFETPDEYTVLTPKEALNIIQSYLKEN